MVLWFGRKRCGLTLKALARWVGRLDYTSVSFAVKRFEQRRRLDKSSQRLIEQVDKALRLDPTSIFIFEIRPHALLNSHEPVSLRRSQIETRQSGHRTLAPAQTGVLQQNRFSRSDPTDTFLCAPFAKAVLHKQFLSGASWRRAVRSRWGPRYGGSKSFEFPGLRGRKLKSFGYRYGGDLDRAVRSHTLAATELLELTSTGSAFTHKFCYRAQFCWHARQFESRPRVFIFPVTLARWK